MTFLVNKSDNECHAGGCYEQATHDLKVRNSVRRVWTSGLGYCVGHVGDVARRFGERGLDTQVIER